MALSIFAEKAFLPNEETLSEALAETKSTWGRIMAYMTDAYKSVNGEWKYYSKAAGWTFVVKSEKRTLVYLIPQKDYFKASFVFGEKAALSAQQTDLPEEILTSISEAKRYAEGRSFMTDVKSDADINVIEKLLKIKNDN